ncbi:class I SAM-dependent RNA methyltransferase [Leptospira idonii]|uniref:Class I SAM-dependent RNA methyltransferase n=1 Tax=Leptospira idonii TaxID=1193500 RepID=A0A4R9LV33_9LEPT|nr:class I SAM-dependent RNA methyltransferase [Leptospira idonii]TGN17885.1 class I SAM-dependent RNA methyltransferase [Leptospira idonii]
MDTIIIDNLTVDFLGEGLSPSGKKVAFPYALPGDEIEVEFVKRKRQRKKMIVHGYLKRKEWEGVHCKHFGACGGCAAQHISYEEQLRIKFDPVIASFAEEIGLTLTAVPAEDPYHYRSRMDFSVFPGRLGLRAKGNFRHVVNVESCSIQSEWADEETNRVHSLLKEFPEIAWNRREESGGGLKYVTIRKAKFTDESITIFTFTEGYETNPLHDLFLKRCSESLLATNLVFCYNRVKAEVSAQGRFTVLRGKEGYYESILGNKFFIPFDSFFQPNPKGFLPILSFVQKVLPENKTRLIDLFCGNGFFSILFGKGFSEIHCYELTPSSVETAKRLLNEKYPESQIHAEVVNLFSDVTGLQSAQDACLVLDPPRAGCGPKVAEWIRDHGPKNVFYVSCNPYSQKEDAKVLLSTYEAKSGILTDPYPHTPHMESVIHFQRKDNP